MQEAVCYIGLLPARKCQKDVSGLLAKVGSCYPKRHNESMTTTSGAW